MRLRFVASFGIVREVVALACALACGFATAPARGELDLPIERRALANGLRVVLSQDRSVPTVGVALYYDVGSAVEEPGRTGFAHLFEHMMFQGTTHVAKAEHFHIVAEAGGWANGTTNEDRTNYFQAVPSSALELILWLEADRMVNLDLTRANFENQRATVIRERQQNIENKPYYVSFLRINELAYEGYFAYSHSVIGDRADLDTMPFEAARAFYETHYVPSNAVLAIAGDFETEAAMVLVERQFGAIPAGHARPMTFGDYPAQTAQRYDVVDDVLAPLPAFHVAYHIPQRGTPEHYALEVLAVYLADGETSPLYRELVKDAAIVQSISVETDNRRGPDLFSVWAVMARAHEPAEARERIDAHIERVIAEGIRPEGLERAKARMRSRFLRSIQSNLGLALQLATYELYWGDARRLSGELDRYDEVTAEDVRGAAAAYLRPENRTVLDVRPAPAAEDHHSKRSQHPGLRAVD